MVDGLFLRLAISLHLFPHSLLIAVPALALLFPILHCASTRRSFRRFAALALASLRSALTECSSNLTSTSCPSLNFHLTTCASSLVSLTPSELASAPQNFEKEGSLIRCQTALKGASITADSATLVLVGMRDIVAVLRVEKDEFVDGDGGVFVGGARW